MGLLDRGPHTLLVWLAVTATDPTYGGTTKTYPGPPITVTGAMVQPVAAAEATALGLQPVTTYRVLCRSWPGGIYSRVEWAGRTLYQRGETIIHSSGRRTRHDTAILAADTTDAR